MQESKEQNNLPTNAFSQATRGKSFPGSPQCSGHSFTDITSILHLHCRITVLRTNVSPDKSEAKQQGHYKIEKVLQSSSLLPSDPLYLLCGIWEHPCDITEKHQYLFYSSCIWCRAPSFELRCVAVQAPTAFWASLGILLLTCTESEQMPATRTMCLAHILTASPPHCREGAEQISSLPLHPVSMA